MKTTEINLLNPHEEAKIRLSEIANAGFIHIGNTIEICDEALVYVIENNISYSENRIDEFTKRYEQISKVNKALAKFDKIGITQEDLSIFINFKK